MRRRLSPPPLATVALLAIPIALLTILGTATLARAELQAAAEQAVTANAASAAQRWPAVAFGDGGYLVVWQRGIGSKADVRAARVDAAGKSLDPAGVTVSAAPGAQHRPEVAHSGQAFLVVWADLRNGKDYDVFGARVDAGGKLLDPTGLLIAGGPGNQARPHVTATPSGFFVVWEHYVGAGYAPRAARVGHDGKLLDAQPIVVSDPGPETTKPEPLGITDKQGIVACEAPRAARVGDQIQVVWTGSATRRLNGAYHVIGARVGLDGKPLDTTPVTIFKPASRVFDARLAAGGGQALTSWTDLRGRGQLGGDGNAQAVGQDGAPAGALVTLGGTTPGREVILPALAHAGPGFVIAFITRQADPQDKTKLLNRLVARRVDPQGTSPGSDLELSTRATSPALASDGAGKALLVYARLPSDHGERPAIAARLLTLE